MNIENNMQVTATNTRAVHGISVATNGRYWASFIDNLVSIWDIRNIEKPLTVHQMEKNVNTISWCATRSSTLGILQRDSPFIQLLDLHAPSVDADTEPHSIKRIITPFQLKSSPSSTRNITLSNITWHPLDVERLLALSGSGAICDFRIQQRVGISFDVFNNLYGSVGVNLVRLNSASPPTTPSETVCPWDTSLLGSDQPLEDIGDVIYRRALNDYGKLVRPGKNVINLLHLINLCLFI